MFRNVIFAGLLCGEVACAGRETSPLSAPLLNAVFDGESDRDFGAGFSLGSYLYVAGGTSFRAPDVIPTALSDSLFAHLSRDGRIGP